MEEYNDDEHQQVTPNSEDEDAFFSTKTYIEHEEEEDFSGDIFNNNEYVEDGVNSEELGENTEDLGVHTEDLGVHTEDLDVHTEDLGVDTEGAYEVRSEKKKKKKKRKREEKELRRYEKKLHKLKKKQQQKDIHTDIHTYTHTHKRDKGDRYRVDEEDKDEHEEEENEETHKHTYTQQQQQFDDYQHENTQQHTHIHTYEQTQQQLLQQQQLQHDKHNHTHAHTQQTHLQHPTDTQTHTQTTLYQTHESPTLQFQHSGEEDDTQNTHYLNIRNDGNPSFFDGVVKKLQYMKRRPRNLTTEESIEFVHSILEEMRKAREEDDEALEQGKPALKKLQLLDHITSHIIKPKWKDLFLEEGVCQGIASWLSPYKDEKLPNITLRNKLLFVINKLPIQSTHLQNSDLGFVLLTLWKHDDETHENRIAIQEIVRRWSRPLLGLNTNLKDYLMSQSYEPKSATQSPVKASTTEKTNIEDPDKYRHARRPRIMGFNFTIPPRSDIHLSESETVKKKTKGHLDRLLDTSRSSNIPRQAQKVSIEGRELH